MTLREEFEAWHKQAYGFVGKSVTFAGKHTYVTTTTRARWEAWQAARGVGGAQWQCASKPPPESTGEVLVRMADGRCEIAWPSYWHDASNAFAQWAFRDPGEIEQPVEWIHIPKGSEVAQ